MECRKKRNFFEKLIYLFISSWKYLAIYMMIFLIIIMTMLLNIEVSSYKSQDAEIISSHEVQVNIPDDLIMNISGIYDEEQGKALDLDKVESIANETYIVSVSHNLSNIETSDFGTSIKITLIYQTSLFKMLLYYNKN